MESPFFLEKGGIEIINIPKIENKIKEIGPKLKKELKKTPKIKKDRSKEKSQALSLN